MGIKQGKKRCFSHEKLFFFGNKVTIFYKSIKNKELSRYFAATFALLLRYLLAENIFPKIGVTFFFKR